MSAIKDGRYPIMLDRERHMLFSLNVMEEMQEKFGGFDKIDIILSGPESMKNMKWLFALVINEGAGPDEEPITEKEAGKMIHTGNMNEVTQAFYAAFSLANRGTDEPLEEEALDEDTEDDEEDEEKNAAAGVVE